MDCRIAKVEALKNSRRLRITFRKPKRVCVVDLSETIDRVSVLTPLRDPGVFADVKPEHFGSGLQWASDGRLEIGADTLLQLAEAQQAISEAETSARAAY